MNSISLPFRSSYEANIKSQKGNAQKIVRRKIKGHNIKPNGASGDIHIK